MHYYDMISLISVILTPIILLYIFVFLFSFGRKYIREYNRSKILKFTQEELKEVRAELNLMRKDGGFREDEIYALVNHFNEIAVGINEGLYDEIYVRMVLSSDMMAFYRELRTDYKEYFSDTENIFLPLELLLKKWDNDGGPTYKLNDNRRLR